jgi:hypothetical protein
VARYFRTAAGNRVPIVGTTVGSGRGHLRVFGLTFPARFRFTHEVGHSYRHDIECTWIGVPILTVTETFLDGHARLDLPLGVVEHDPKTDQGANLNLWGEAVWSPSVLVTDPRVRWEAIMDHVQDLIRLVQERAREAERASRSCGRREFDALQATAEQYVRLYGDLKARDEIE